MEKSCTAIRTGWVLDAEPFNSDGFHLLPASCCLFHVVSCKGFEPYLEPLFPFAQESSKSQHLSPQVGTEPVFGMGLVEKKERERSFNCRDHPWLRNATGEKWKSGRRRSAVESFSLFIADLLLRRARLFVTIQGLPDCHGTCPAKAPFLDLSPLYQSILPGGPGLGLLSLRFPASLSDGSCPLMCSATLFFLAFLRHCSLSSVSYVSGGKKPHKLIIIINSRF